MKPQDRTRAILRSGLDAESKIIAVALCDYMGGACDLAWPSVPTLSRDTGLGQRTIQRRIAAGVAAGWLTVREVPGRANAYGVSFAVLPAGREVEREPNRDYFPRQADTPQETTSPVRESPPSESHPRQPDTPPPSGSHPRPRQPDGGRDQLKRPVKDQEPPYPPSPTGDASPSPDPTPHDDQRPPDTDRPGSASLRDLDHPAGESPAPSVDAGASGCERGEGGAAEHASATPYAGHDRRPVTEVWAEMNTIRRDSYPEADRARLRALALTPARKRAMSTRIREHGADDVLTAWRWMFMSPDRSAAWLRTEGHANPETFLRPGNCAKYIEHAHAPTRPDAPQQTATAVGDLEAERGWRWLVGLAAAPGGLPAPENDRQRVALELARELNLFARWASITERDLGFLKRDFIAAYAGAKVAAK